MHNGFSIFTPMLVLVLALPCIARADADGCANPVAIADLRVDPIRPDTRISAVERERLARDVLGSANADLVVNSVARGAFVAAGGEQTLYLLQKGGPDATTPGAQKSFIAVYEKDRLLHVFPNSAGNFIEATPLLAPSATRSVLLRADSYQMGVASARLVLVDLDKGRLEQKMDFGEVLSNRCDDVRFGGDVEVALITCCADRPTQAGRFMTTRYRAQCVDGKMPPAKAFRIVPAVEARP